MKLTTLLLATTLLLGCGDDDSTPTRDAGTRMPDTGTRMPDTGTMSDANMRTPDGGAPIVPLAGLPEWFAASASFFCDWECILNDFGDHDECVEQWLPVLRRDGDDATLQAAVASGRVVFDGEAAARCLVGAAEESCLSAVVDYGTIEGALNVWRCPTIYRGTVPPGGACYTGLECMGGEVYEAECEIPDGECVGTCVSTGAGIACGEGASCGRLLYCDAESGTCLERREEGAACTELKQCRFGTGCLGGVCAAPPETVMPGAACVSDTQCPGGHSCQRAVAEPHAYVCQPDLAIGATCDRDVGPNCPRDSSCTGAGSPVCSPRLHPGDACTGPFSCFAEFLGANWCDTTATPTPVCRGRSTVGEPCSAMDDSYLVSSCQAGLYCREGLCATALTNGTACTSDRQCMSARCVSEICTPACMPPAS